MGCQMGNVGILFSMLAMDRGTEPRPTATPTPSRLLFAASPLTRFRPAPVRPDDCDRFLFMPRRRLSKWCSKIKGIFGKVDFRKVCINKFAASALIKIVLSIQLCIAGIAYQSVLRTHRHRQTIDDYFYLARLCLSITDNLGT